MYMYDNDINPLVKCLIIRSYPNNKTGKTTPTYDQSYNLNALFESIVEKNNSHCTLNLVKLLYSIIKTLEVGRYLKHVII